MSILNKENEKSEHEYLLQMYDSYKYIDWSDYAI